MNRLMRDWLDCLLNDFMTVFIFFRAKKSLIEVIAGLDKWN